MNVSLSNKKDEDSSGHGLGSMELVKALTAVTAVEFMWGYHDGSNNCRDNYSDGYNDYRFDYNDDCKGGDKGCRDDKNIFRVTVMTKEMAINKVIC